MKTFVLGAFVALAIVVALASRGESTTQTNAAQSTNSSAIQQGMDKVDAYLQKGLTPEAHAVIAEKAKSSADWLRGLEQQAYDAAASR